jgi:hypothetical protein
MEVTIVLASSRIHGQQKSEESFFVGALKVLVFDIV